MAWVRVFARPVALVVVAVGLAAPAASAATSSSPAPTSVAVDGTLRVIHADDFVHHRMHMSYEVQRPGHPAVRVESKRDFMHLDHKHVHARGLLRGGVLTEATVVPDGVTPKAASLPVVGATGAQRVAVVMVTFADNRTQPFTAAQVADTMFNATASVNTYYQISSDHQISLTGDVFGWYPIAATSTACQTEVWEPQARTAAANAGVNLASYKYVMFVFPPTAACTWGGAGYVGADVTYDNGALDVGLMAHELGHNFGAYHASARHCTDGAGTPVPLSATCNTDDQEEYGDPYAVMGSGLRTTQGILGVIYGWQTAQSVTTDGVYHLAPLHSGATPPVLRIPRSPDESFDLDLRSTLAQFDTFPAGDTATRGVTVRLDGTVSTANTVLLDMAPATRTMTDSALLPGMTFTDPVSGVRITTVSIDASGATVNVDLPDPDVTPPSAVTSLRGTRVGPVSADLAWTAATDNRQISSYRVTRGSVVLTTKTPSIRVSALSPLNTYTWSVAAVDTSGNVGPATTLTVTTPAADTTPPSPATNLAVAFTGLRTFVTWTAATDNDNVLYYIVGRPKGLPTSYAATPEFPDVPLAVNETATWTVTAVDETGNQGPTVPVTVTRPGDVTPPTPPTNLTVTTTGTTATLRWNAATDNVGIARYDITRTSQPTRSTTGLQYTESNLVPGTQYTWSVVSVDTSGNASVAATVSAQIGPDTIAPSTPTGLAVTTTGTTATLQWNAATDNVGIARYDITRTSQPTRSTTGLQYTESNLAPGTQYTWSVVSVDTSGNASVAATVTGRTPDTLAPSAPAALGVTTTMTTATLHWNASTDNVGVAGYLITQDSMWINVTTATTFVVTGLLPGRTYTFGVVAYDAAVNVSIETKLAARTLTDTTPPSAPRGFAVAAMGTTNATLQWIASTDDVGVAAYRIFRNGVLVGTVAGRTTFADAGLTQLTTYIWSVVAVDATGNVSSPTYLAAHTNDGLPPSAPQYLQVVADSNRATLRWSPAADNVGIGWYRVQRGSTVFTTTATSFVDTGLASSTGYTWYVWAIDYAGNVGPAVAVYAATSVAGAPTTPINLTAYVVTATKQVQLAWSASTDTGGVITYAVRRNGNRINAVTKLSAADKPGRGTWSYSIVAIDPGDHHSNPSPSVTVTIT